MDNKYELLCYETDASRIKGTVVKVYHPETVEEVKKIVNESEFDIVSRGSGTNLVGGCVPNNSIVVDMRKMNKVTNYDPSKQTILVEAGVTLKELNEKLKQINKEFPICINEQSTIGGMIAINCIGDKSLRYGVMKEFVEELEFVNGNGEIVKIGRLDLSDVCGMEGVTGIIVRAKLRLISIPKKSLSIFQSDNLKDIITIARVLKNERQVVSLKFYSKKISTFLGFPEKYHLFIGFDSEQGKIIGEEYDKIINKISYDYYFIYKHSYSVSEDFKLYYDKIEDFITFLEELNIPYIGDLGLTIINPFFKLESDKINKVITYIKKTGGKKGRYGIGLKRKYLIDNLEEKIILRTKNRLDPFWKFNNGKLIDRTNIRETNSLNKDLSIIKEELNFDNKGDNTKTDYNLIKSVMTNTSKENNQEITNMKNKSINKDSEFSKLNEKDLINKIMTNNLNNISKKININEEKNNEH